MAEVSRQNSQSPAEAERLARLREAQQRQQQAHRVQSAGTVAKTGGTAARVAGGATQAAGTATKAAGKGMQAAGEGVKQAGQKVSEAGKGAQAKGQEMKSAGKAAQGLPAGISPTDRALAERMRPLSAKEALNPVEANRWAAREAQIGKQVRGGVLAFGTPATAPAQEKDEEAMQPGPISPTNAARQAVQAERLTAQRQQVRMRGKATSTSDAKKTSQGALTSSQRAQRDLRNDFIDRAMITNPAGILWFNLKLVLGHMIAKGEDSRVSPPSWRFLHLPLPDVSARGVIVAMDISLLFAAFLVILSLVLVVTLVVTLTNSLIMKELVLGNLGSVGRFIINSVL